MASFALIIRAVCEGNLPVLNHIIENSVVDEAHFTRDQIATL